MSTVSLSFALGGIQAADSSVTAAASDLAAGPTAAAGAGPNVPGDMVSLSAASVQMAASVQVARTQEQMQKTLLDLFA